MNAGLQSCYISIYLSQIQHESMYYITERDPVKKQQHSNNLAHLYALLDQFKSTKRRIPPEIKQATGQINASFLIVYFLNKNNLVLYDLKYILYKIQSTLYKINGPFYLKETTLYGTIDLTNLYKSLT